MKHVYRLLTFVTWILAATSCSKDAGQVTSPESMILGCDSLRLGNDAQTEITLELTTDQAWVLDSVLPASGTEAVDWLTVYDQEGSGNATVKLSCKQNENPADRLALVRFKIQGAYAEYRTCTVIQSGTPTVTTKAIVSTTAESITLAGSYTYTGEYLSKTGFEIWKNDNTEEKEIVYAETSKSNFSLKYPVEHGNDYHYRAFVEGFAGKIFTADNEESISIRFTPKTPSIEGTLRSNVEIKDAYVVFPYHFGDGKNYNVSATCNIEGVSIETQEVNFDPNGGEIRLKITGIPTTSGTATFSPTGFPEVFNEVLVSTEILQGGSGLLLYHETFGPKPDGDKPYNLTSKPIGEVIDDIEFSRIGQPSAEYIRYTDKTHIRHEPVRGSKPEDYVWASGSPVLYAAKNTQAILCINKLNVTDATNIKLDFGYCSYASKYLKEITIEYSNDGGKTWTEVDWELTVPFVSGKYIQAQTISEIIGSNNLSLRLMLDVPSNGADVRLDDLRLLGDYL